MKLQILYRPVSLTKKEDSMSKQKMNNDVSINKMWNIYNRARNHYIYFDEESKNDKSRKLESFLMLAVVLEEMICSLGLKCLKEMGFKKLYEKRKNDNYSIENAINDLYLLEKISDDEFQKMKKFQKDRNECFHEILGQKNEWDIEIHANKLFDEHKRIFKLITEKLVEEQKPKNTS